MYAAHDTEWSICDGELFSTFPIFCQHSSKFTCHPIFWVPEQKNCRRTLDVGCRKSESDTCKQPNINEKDGKSRYRKSAVGCRKPHTCVRRLSVTGLLVIVYGLPVSVYGLSVTIFPDSRTQSVKVTDWPVKFTDLLGTLTDRPAKVTDCTVTLPTRLVSHHVQSGSPYLGQAGYLLQTDLFD